MGARELFNHFVSFCKGQQVPVGALSSAGEVMLRITQGRFRWKDDMAPRGLSGTSCDISLSDPELGRLLRLFERIGLFRDRPDRKEPLSLEDLMKLKNVHLKHPHNDHSMDTRLASRGQMKVSMTMDGNVRNPRVHIRIFFDEDMNFVRLNAERMRVYYAQETPLPRGVVGNMPSRI